MYSLIFPFSEINSAVFQNAAIYLNSRDTGNQFIVFAPSEFIGCYFHAHVINEIKFDSFRNYSDVSNYLLKPFSKSDPKTWLSAQVPNYLHQRILHALPVSMFHSLPPYLKSDYKSRRFLFQSGIYKSIKRISKASGYDFLGTGNYINLASMQQFSYDQKDYFTNHFKNLELMILGGGLQNSLSRQLFTDNWLVRLQNNDQNYLDFFKMNTFISKNPKTIFIRTRNIPGPASVHNTNIEMLDNLVNKLLNNGYSVINSGTPTFSLDIYNHRYLQVDHNLPVVVQQFLASKCYKTVTSAEAGLFTAWAASDIPLVTFGDEWSVTNLPEKISLLRARLKLGITDYSIGNGKSYAIIKKVFDFN